MRSMTLPVVDREAALTNLRNASGKFVKLLREVEDPDRPAIGYWSIGEVAVHVSHIFQLYPDIAAGKSSPVEDHLRLGEAWDRFLREDETRDPAVAAERIERGAADLVDATRSAEWDKLVSWHGGVEIPVYSLTCFLINECEVHGLDVSRAEDKPWTIAPDVARLILDGHFPVLPYFVNQAAARGFRANYELRVRGGSTVYANFDNGLLTIDVETNRPVDCRISFEPVDYLLLGYGRKSQWSSVLTGKIVAYGRKPWLGLRLPKLLHSV
jgi:uncharacterized protein (TIGR03083 family)